MRIEKGEAELEEFERRVGMPSKELAKTLKGSERNTTKAKAITKTRCHRRGRRLETLRSAWRKPKASRKVEEKQAFRRRSCAQPIKSRKASADGRKAKNW